MTGAPLTWMISLGADAVAAELAGHSSPGRETSGASRTPRGFPHDFLAGADYILGGMTTQLDLPPGRFGYG